MRKRKSVLPDPQDVRDPKAVQAGVRVAPVTSVVVTGLRRHATKVLGGLAVGPQVDGLAVRVPGAMPVLLPGAMRVLVLVLPLVGETSVGTTGVVASAIVVNADVVAQSRTRARVAVVVAEVVVVVAVAKITTRAHRLAAAPSTTSKTGIRPSAA